MSFLTDASLVFIPSGYKEDKAYSIKPTDGSGDLTFTRASDGTRVNTDGLVERVPWNLAPQSNTFNTTWSRTNTFVPTANATTNPINGQNDAWKLVETAVNDFHFIYQNIANFGGVQQCTFSFYAKAAERTTCSAFLSQSGNVGASFNLSTGVATASGTGNTASMQDAGNGWWRCTVTNNGSASVSNQVRIGIQDGALGSYLGDGTSGIYIYAAQANEGTLKPYFPTTNRQDVPRLDYSNGCPCLLLEPQRTNLEKYSEDFSNAFWTKLNCTITTNNTTAPNGTLTADLITSTGTNETGVYHSLSVSGTNTWSIYAKKGTGRYLLFNTNSPPTIAAKFDLQDGVIVGTPSTGATPSIQSVGDGWYRCIITSSTSTNRFTVFISDNTTTDDFSSSVGLTYYLWGAQVEQGSYPTSYIPTTSAAVTRLADAAYKTGISDLIGQSEGTLFVEYQSTNNGGSGERIIAISNGTAANRIVLFDQLGKIRVYTATGSAVQWDITTSINTLGHHKIAIGYKTNDAVLYIDGTQITTDTTYSVPACSAIYVGTSEAYGISLAGVINQAAIYKTRLTNDQLEVLTGDSYQSYTAMADALTYYYD